MIGKCERCGEIADEANIEAFELTGLALCESCADEEFARRAEELEDADPA